MAGVAEHIVVSKEIEEVRLVRGTRSNVLARDLGRDAEKAERHEGIEGWGGDYGGMGRRRVDTATGVASSSLDRRRIASRHLR